MNYRSFNLGDWIGHISGVIEDESELDGNEMRDLVKFLSGLPRWIPVSKRLPDEEHEVYCQLSDGSNAVLYVQDNWGQMEWVDGMMGTGTYDVVAWMEKPKPYKAERNEE